MLKDRFLSSLFDAMMLIEKRARKTKNVDNFENKEENEIEWFEPFTTVVYYIGSKDMHFTS